MNSTTENKKPSKYIIVYNGIMFPVNSIEEAAKRLFGFRIEEVKHKDGHSTWDVIINGAVVEHYIKKADDLDRNGYTREEVENIWSKEVNFIPRNTFSNLQWYKLMKFDKVK